MVLPVWTVQPLSLFIHKCQLRVSDYAPPQLCINGTSLTIACCSHIGPQGLGRTVLLCFICHRVMNSSYFITLTLVVHAGFDPMTFWTYLHYWWSKELSAKPRLRYVHDHSGHVGWLIVSCTRVICYNWKLIIQNMRLYPTTDEM